MLRGQVSNVNNVNNPSTHEIPGARSQDGLPPPKGLFDDFYKFGRNLIFGRFDDIGALNIGADFTEKIQSKTLIGRQYKRTLPVIGTYT